MRLLERTAAGEFRLTRDFPDDEIPPYAILSHTWGHDEVLYGDLVDGKGSDKIGYDKIRFCGNQAWRDGLRFSWVDTCCINKLDIVELQEAINSMFRWYRIAAKCYVYLADVSMSSSNFTDKASWTLAFQKSRWFTRGWTLQELIAPTLVEFFSQDGVRLGDKKSLESDICQITGLPLALLRGGPLSDYSVSERLSWIKSRETTRKEDRAYSLLGICGIYMPLIYGEGEEHAFKRLRKEIQGEQPDPEYDEAAHTPAQIRQRSTGSRDGGHRPRPSFQKIEILKALHASPYRDRKNRNPDRIPGTCEWFVTHERFQTWRESTSSSMLWVSADPGCGKSVLAKYLVDTVLPTTRHRTTCYFFFKDDFEDQRSAKSALCCILHQLFEQRDVLSREIAERFEAYGERLTGSVAELWEVLVMAAQQKNAGEIVCILDAFDECDEQGRTDLTRALCKFYGTTNNFNLKFLLTSRPYGDIRRGFQPLDLPDLPVIRLSGESEAEMSKISKEIDIFIEARVRSIQAILELNPEEEQLLKSELLRIPHRTYLWVHLTLDLVQTDINIDKIGIQKATSRLPHTVDDAYERILAKSCDVEEARKLLHIVTAAARPLTLSEMGLALALRESGGSYTDIELKPEKRFREYVRDLCGLFVTIIGSKIYLLHQTAKEFLVQNDSRNTRQGHNNQFEWKSSLQPRVSHQLLAQICVWYLLFTESEPNTLHNGWDWPRYLHDHVFLDYSARHWAAHFRISQIDTDAMVASTLEICHATPESCPTWFGIYWESAHGGFPLGFTALMIASYFGLGPVVKILLQAQDLALDASDNTHSRSAISWAAENGFDDVVKLLIKGPRIRFKDIAKLSFSKGAKFDAWDIHGRTPLSYAARKGHVAVIKRLVKAGARVSSRDRSGGTPLAYALCSGQESLIVPMLNKGQQLDSIHDIIQSLWFSAVEQNDETTIKLLLDSGKGYPDMKDAYFGQTPLMRAVLKGHVAVVRLLLDSGRVDADWKDNDGQTPLSCAVQQGHTAVVRLLLENSRVDADWKDNGGWTLLSFAALQGYTAVVKLLLDSGKVDADPADKSDYTPLLRAAQGGRAAVVKLLLESGRVDVNSKDRYVGRTPLSFAAGAGHAAVVTLLLENSKVDADSKDKYGYTPLSHAAQGGRAAIVKLLLESGRVDVNSKDKSGQTPLSYAAWAGHVDAVRLLLESGKADVNWRDRMGRTLLSPAKGSIDPDVAEQLRLHGAC